MKKIIAFVTVIMLAVSLSAFSQDTKVKDSDGKMHIKIEIDKDGKTTRVDTSINAEDLAALNEQLKDLDVHIGSPDNFPGVHEFNFDWDGEKLNEQMKELEKNLDDKEINMKDFDKQMKAMGEKIKGHCYRFKYKMETDADSEKGTEEIKKEIENSIDNMNFNLNDNGKSKTIIIDGNDIKIDGAKGGKEIIIKQKGNTDKKDRKENKKVIIIMKSSGAPEKQKAEFAAEPTREKEIKQDTENANRVRPVEKNKNENNSWLNDLTCYPNPSTGEFTLSFRLTSPEPAELKIMDLAGREVYAETISRNAELVEKQIKLPAKSSAAYLLILRQGDNWHHEKLFVRS